jgi:simple sugar transport system substrate-binding protein
MYKVSGTLTGLAETDTGLKFLDKTTIDPYVKTKTRYEGTSSAVQAVA